MKKVIAVISASLTAGGAFVINQKYIVRGSNCRDMMLIQPKQIIGKQVTLHVEDETDVTPTGLIHALVLDCPAPTHSLLELTEVAERIYKTRAEARSISQPNQRSRSIAKTQAEEAGEVKSEAPAAETTTAAAVTGTQPIAEAVVPEQ